jgi:hypothetical protein
MAFRPRHVYQLTGEKLRELCVEVGIDSEGTVRALRRRLVDFLRHEEEGDSSESNMDTTAQIGATGDSPPPSEDDQRQVGQGDNCIPVLVELLRKIPSLTASDPEEIMTLLIRLNGIHKLKLVSDKIFMTRVLPLLTGDMLALLGECLREGKNWEQYLVVIRGRIFPHFVRERLIRDFVVCKVQGQGDSLREHVNRVFSVAEFLEYQSTEQELVDRVVMNLHPSFLAHTALLGRPCAREELLDIIGLIEERVSVCNSREANPNSRSLVGGRFSPSKGSSSKSLPGVKCWNCGRTGHLKRNCRRGPNLSGNGAAPGGSTPPGRES